MKLLMISVVIIFASHIEIAAQGLKVEPGTCIKVEADSKLDIEIGDFILESDITGDASLIDFGSITYSGGGETKVKRYLTKGEWHLISPPISNAFSGMFDGNYIQYYTESTNSYIDITSLTHPLIPMQGYALWITEDMAVTKTFAGATNTGTNQFAITALGERWNLTGNPYPSAIDWDKVTIPNDMNGTYYVWNPRKGNNGDYENYISGGGGGNTTSQFISSGQGFFVRTNEGAQQQLLLLDNSVRTHCNQLFYKNNITIPELVFSITGNNVTTKTSIRFIPESTPMIDDQYDSEKLLSGNPDIPNLYSYATDKIMAINSLPSIDDYQIVEMGFLAGINGKYTLEASDFENIPIIYPIFLEDIEIEYYHDLRINKQYTFEYEAGEEKAFRIHFKDITDVNEIMSVASLFNCYFNGGKLIVNYLGKEPFYASASISIYNTIGQNIFQTKITQPYNEISFYGTAAMYIVCINYRNSHYVNKLFNK